MRPDPTPRTGPGGRPSADLVLPRRRVLTGMGAAGLLALGGSSLLAACGGSSDKGQPSTMSLTEAGDQLVGLFNYQGNYLVTGIPQRAVFAVATAEGPPDPNGPASLDATLTRQGVKKADVVLERHAEGTPIGYYPLVTTFDEPGVWGLTTTIDGKESTQNFQVSEKGQVKLVQPGSPMVPVATPTVADARGVNPICTRDPQCPLHDRSLAEVLAARRPVALMISTPKYCQTAVCGPVLDMVMEQAASRPDIAFVHAEVYMDPGSGADPAAKGTTPVIDAYGLSFEPSLYVARADGTITTRLDNVFDKTELAKALDGATA